MKFEKKMAGVIVVYIVLVIGLMFGLIMVQSPESLEQLKQPKITAMTLTGVVCALFGIFLVVKMLKKLKKSFLQALIQGHGDELKFFEEFKRIRHHYKMERFQSRLSETEKQYLEEKYDERRKEWIEAESKVKTMKDEQQRLEIELERMELLFINVANTMEENVWVTDENGILTFANNSLIHLVPSTTMGDSVSGIVRLSEEELGYLKRRDYNDLDLQVWDDKGTPLSVNGRRVMKEGHINNFIFVGRPRGKRNTYREIVKRNLDFNFLVDSFETLGQSNITSTDVSDFLQSLCIYNRFNSASIRFVSTDGQWLEPYALYSNDTFIVNHDNVPVEGTYMGKAFKNNRQIVLNGPKDLTADPGMLQYEHHIANAVRSGMKIGYFPLKVQDKDIGVLSIVSNATISDDLALLIKSVSINLSVAIEKIMLYDRLKKNYFGVVRSILQAFEIKSKYMLGHSSRVAEICGAIADELYYDNDERDDLYRAALLHDIGKMMFSSEPYKYAFDIWEHGRIGREIVQSAGLSRDVLDGIEFHHDDFITEERIQPIYAQFIRLANDFDVYMNICPSRQRGRDFISKIARKREGEYAPTLVNVLEHLVEHDCEKLMKIYVELSENRGCGEMDCSEEEVKDA